MNDKPQLPRNPDEVFIVRHLDGATQLLVRISNMPRATTAHWRAWVVLVGGLLDPHLPALAAATLRVDDAMLPTPLVWIAYGDMRFTSADETVASNPAARRALVAKIASERPAALFINGDVTWHGAAADYDVYRAETTVWQDEGLRVFPALGNHEFSGCDPPQCLDRWWRAFPDASGSRWYAVSLGTRVYALMLDSTSSLLPGSEQRMWLEDQLATLDDPVGLVLVVMHHPPLADIQTRRMVDHNPRANEQSLADFLDGVSRHGRLRFIVSAGHIHNYERLERAGVVYLVSGGGGARPYEVDRTAEDRYTHGDFPNFHYVRFTLDADRVVGEMVRLEDGTAPAPGKWAVGDRFSVTLAPPLPKR